MNKLELYGIALVVLLAVLVGAYFKGRSVGVEVTENKFASAALEQERKATEKESADRALINQSSATYESHIADLRAAIALKPSSSVRVCNTNASQVPSAATTPSKFIAADPAQLGAANGSDHSIDIGPALDRYKEDVQALALRCDAILKAWPR